MIFYSLEKAIKTTEELYNDGLQDHLFSFASSMLGNQFCFDLDECSSESDENAAVLCFFQDDKEVYYIADSFTQLIFIIDMIPLSQRINYAIIQKKDVVHIPKKPLTPKI